MVATVIAGHAAAEGTVAGVFDGMHTEMLSVAASAPRYEDTGMTDIRELVRMISEKLLDSLMDAQVDELCGCGVQRNGCRERVPDTVVRPVTMHIPKPGRGPTSSDDFVGRRSGPDRMLAAYVHEMVVSGVSTRKVEKVAEAMGLASLSASQVSSMCRELDACVENLQSRLFGNAGFPYVFLDATYISCRDSGRVSKAALVTAIGCCSAGMRWLLGLDVVDVES